MYSNSTRLTPENTEKRELTSRTIVNGVVKESIHLVSSKRDGKSILKGHINGKPIYIKHIDDNSLQRIPPEHTSSVQDFLSPSASYADRMPTPFVEPSTDTAPQSPSSTYFPHASIHNTLSTLVEKEPTVLPVTVTEPFVSLEPMSVENPSTSLPSVMRMDPTVERIDTPEITLEWFEPTVEYQDIPIKRKQRHSRNKRQQQQRQQRQQRAYNSRRNRSRSRRSRSRTTSRKRV